MRSALASVLTATAFLAALASARPAVQQTSVVDTKHNLSISGPGPYRSTEESRICIFCHTPHRARSIAPLWNREDSRETYLTYTSSTFGGDALQPMGATKLCLSCHDGSIALGKVISLDQEIEMSPGHRFLDQGPAFLGTNLLDDHPVSFYYVSTPASGGRSRADYLDPSSIVPPVHLDPQGFVQCTSCHDPHNNAFGNFLLATDRYSELCLSCHAPSLWPSASHRNSNATWDGGGLDPWPHARYDTVAENACTNCHMAHNAGHPERLFVFEFEEDNCLRCHNGHVAAKDVEAELSKPYSHDPFATSEVHDPIEDPLAMARHSECQDCHDPHAARSGTAQPPQVPGPNLDVSGLDSSGQAVPSIRFLYELCYKCHADNHGGTIHVPRQVQQANTRVEFNPGNPSFHPLEAPGANPSVPSLLPPWNESSMLACTDCHASDDSPGFGGSGPAGPHGSVYRPLLGANYELADNSAESPAAYALCYKCHSRESILDDDSFKRHKKHVEGENTPCSVCHDSHGISSSAMIGGDHTHLINFDISVVSPSPTTGQLFFEERGFRAGSCTLMCHGEDHVDAEYH